MVRRAWFVALGLGTAWGVAAQPPLLEKPTASLALEEVLASVTRHYPLIEAVRQETQVAQMDLLSAQGGFDPELRARGTVIPIGPYPYTRVDTFVAQATPFWGANFFGGWRYGSGDIPPYYGNLETLSFGELRVGANVPLWRNGPIDRRRATIERSELGVSVASQAVVASELDASRTAAHRYWDWVAAGKRKAIAQELFAIARERDGQIAQRVRQGDLPAFERIDNQRALVQRESQVVAAERLVQQTALELSLFLRTEEGTPLLPSSERLPNFPEPEGTPTVDAEALAGVMSRRPDVARLSAQANQQRVDARLASNQEAPLIDVTVAAAKDFGGGNTRLGRPELEVGLSIDIPILNRGARGRTGAARAAAVRADALVQLQKERSVVEVRDALSAVDAARQRVVLARRERDAARELAKGERTRLNQGDSSLLFVNLREQTAAEAEVREVDALAEYFKATATLRAAMALPLREMEKK
ncbi:MAG: TolC family protein [Myxococcaceae bacterium]